MRSGTWIFIALIALLIVAWSVPSHARGGGSGGGGGSYDWRNIFNGGSQGSNSSSPSNGISSSYDISTGDATVDALLAHTLSGVDLKLNGIFNQYSITTLYSNGALIISMSSSGNYSNYFSNGNSSAYSNSNGESNVVNQGGPPVNVGTINAAQNVPPQAAVSQVSAAAVSQPEDEPVAQPSTQSVSQPSTQPATATPEPTEEDKSQTVSTTSPVSSPVATRTVGLAGQVTYASQALGVTFTIVESAIDTEAAKIDKALDARLSSGQTLDEYLKEQSFNDPRQRKMLAQMIMNGIDPQPNDQFFDGVLYSWGDISCNLDDIDVFCINGAMVAYGGNPTGMPGVDGKGRINLNAGNVVMQYDPKKAGLLTPTVTLKRVQWNSF